MPFTWFVQFVDKIIAGGNTISTCAIDLTKAFDKVITITVCS